MIAEEIAAGNDAEAALRPFNLVMERRLAALASLVLRDHPREYIEWVTSGFLHGVYRVVLCLPLRALLLVVMSSLPLVLAIRILRRGGDPPAAEPGEGGGHAAGLAGITLVATSFCLACLGLISLVSWPLPRYLVLANLLLPSALGGALFVLWANTLRGIELRRSR